MRQVGPFVAGMAAVCVGAASAQAGRAPAPAVSEIRESVERAEYGYSEIEGEAGVWSAPNRSQGLRSRVSSAGLEVFERTTGADGVGVPWRLLLRTAHFGREGHLRELGGATARADGSRMELDHSALLEWIENRDEGIEQGWTIARRPFGVESLWIGLSVSGDVSLRIDEGGRSGVFVDATGAIRLRYRGLQAWDASGRDLPAAIASSASGLGIRIDDRGAQYPITVDPVLTGPAWTAESNQDSALFGAAVASAGDVNGDGYSDVIVGAPAYDNGQLDEGRAYVYLGSPSGLGATAAWTAEGDQAFANFGNSVASAGDVNGDGFSDVIVGAHRYDNGQGDEGRALVYLGSASGLGTTPSWTAESNQAGAFFGFCVSGAGNVNGDAYSDVVVGASSYTNGEADEGRAYVYLGSASGLSAAPAWTAEANQAGAGFGSAVASAGDVNGDGYGDVLVGIPSYDAAEIDAGRAVVYLGSAIGLGTSAAWTFDGDQAGALLGSSVASAWDVNADAYGDVVVGAPLYDYFTTLDEGRAYAFLGSAAGPGATPAWVTDSYEPGAGYGTVSGIGDVNGDGYADVAAGAPHGDSGQIDDGGVFVYLGNATGLSFSPSWVASGDQPFAQFGGSVSAAGDVNGDGYSDVIIGAQGFSNGESFEGRAFVYMGSAIVPTTDSAWATESDQSSANLGWSVADAGDVNGDGFGDVIVGAPYFDNGQSDEGRAGVYLGSSSGLASTPAWTTEGDQASALFGWSVAGAGDVNGDGYDDVIVGAPTFDNSPPDEGRAYVYFGSPSGLGASPAWTAEGDQAFGQFGYSVARAGDVDGDGFGDVLVGAPRYENGDTDEGVVFLFKGSRAGPVGPVWAGEGGSFFSQFGYSVAGAGDVNGDGYSDVAIGAPFYSAGENTEGAAFLFLGSSLGLESTPTWSAESNQQDARLGTSVAGAGDVNDDGFGDLLVGSPNYGNGGAADGVAFVYLGSGSGLPPSANTTLELNVTNAMFAFTVGSAGDVNNDGYSDVVIGARNAGRVSCFLGSASGVANTSSWEVFVGSVVSGAGDVNGDGFSDVIVGSPFYTNPEGSEGRAVVYLGNQGTAGWILTPQQRRVGGGAPIAVLGRSNSTVGFEIRVSLVRSAAGFLSASPMPPSIRIEWEVDQGSGTAFDGLGLGAGPEQSVASLPVVFDQLVDGLLPDTPYRWRARFRTNNPLFPVTPWFSPQGSARTETKLRTAKIPGQSRPASGVSGTVSRNL